MSDTTRDYVETMMKSTLHTLRVIGKARSIGAHVSDEGDHLVNHEGGGIEPVAYLREMVLEARTPKHACCTDFVLTLGGPRIWVRSWTRTDDAALYGQANGMAVPITWPIERHAPEYRSIEMLLDFDLMEDEL